MPTNIVHARVVTRRPDRRIMGSSGESRTVCGAPPSLFDLPVRDAKRYLWDSQERFSRDMGTRHEFCESCKEALERETDKR